MYREICQTDLSEFHSTVWEKSPKVSKKLILLCCMAIIAILLYRISLKNSLRVPQFLSSTDCEHNEQRKWRMNKKYVVSVCMYEALVYSVCQPRARFRSKLISGFDCSKWTKCSSALSAIRGKLSIMSSTEMTKERERNREWKASTA